MFLLNLQLPPTGPAAPCRAGCRATPTCACGCGLPEALLCTIRGHLQGTEPVNEGEASIANQIVQTVLLFIAGCEMV